MNTPDMNFPRPRGAAPTATNCDRGIHHRVLEGGGLMQDALTCVDCGRDAYPEVFGMVKMILPWPEGMIDRSPEGRQRAWEKASQRRHDEKIALYAFRYAAPPEAVERWLAQNPPRTRWQRFILWWKGLFK